MGGRSEYDRECFKFKDKEFQTIMGEMKRVGRYKIENDAMQEVVDIAVLEKEYKFFKEFETVPKACRYYRDQLGDEFTINALKKLIKNKARILEDGQVIEDWTSLINPRINAWHQHEKNKYK